MLAYEIRILRQTDGARLVVTANLMGAYAAMRRARMLAAEGDMVEVWHGASCIYSSIRGHVH